MDSFGLIGFPISFSLSPRLFRAAYGGELEYSLIECPDFEEVWRIFTQGPYKAVNVTAPFKEICLKRADIPSPECIRVGAANILLKSPEGIRAYNSDYLAVRSILSGLGALRTVAVVGFGGAGKAALRAAEDSGFEVSLYRHDALADGIEADAVIYTLPGAVPGILKIKCRHLLEANYRDPVLTGHPGYISGKSWLLEQAVLGYPVMTGRKLSSDQLVALAQVLDPELEG